MGRERRGMRPVVQLGPLGVPLLRLPKCVVDFSGGCGCGCVSHVTFRSVAREMKARGSCFQRGPLQSKGIFKGDLQALPRFILIKI